MDFPHNQTDWNHTSLVRSKDGLCTLCSLLIDRHSVDDDASVSMKSLAGSKLTIHLKLSSSRRSTMIREGSASPNTNNSVLFGRQSIVTLILFLHSKHSTWSPSVENRILDQCIQSTNSNLKHSSSQYRILYYFKLSYESIRNRFNKGAFDLPVIT